MRLHVVHLPSREDRCGRSAGVALGRIALSIALARVPRLARPAVRLRMLGPRIYADLRTPFGLRLYRYGFCDPLAAYIRSQLKPGDSFVDGGANVGIFTLTAAATVGPTGRVVACEPSAATMAALRANVALNGFGWVDLHQVGLAERRGRVEFFSFGATPELSSFAPADVAHATRHEVETATLDDLARGLPRLALVKLDIEGAEVRALRGARDVLENIRPDLVVEVEPDHLARQGSSVEELAALLADARYDMHALVRRGNAAELRPVRDLLLALDPRHPNIVARPRDGSKGG